MFLILVIVFVVILVVTRRKKQKMQKNAENKKDVLEPEVMAPAPSKPSKAGSPVKAERMDAKPAPTPASATATKTYVSPPPAASKPSTRPVAAPSPRVQLQRWGADDDKKETKEGQQALLPPASQQSPEGMDAGPDVGEGPDAGGPPDAQDNPDAHDGPDTSLPVDEAPKEPAKEELFKW